MCFTLRCLASRLSVCALHRSVSVPLNPLSVSGTQQYLFLQTLWLCPTPPGACLSRASGYVSHEQSLPSCREEQVTSWHVHGPTASGTFLLKNALFFPHLLLPKSGPTHQETEVSFSSRVKAGDSQGRGVAHVLKRLILKCRAGGVMSSQGLSGKLEGWLAGLLPSFSRRPLLPCGRGPSLRTGHIAREAKSQGGRLVLVWGGLMRLHWSRLVLYNSGCHIYCYRIVSLWILNL